MQLNDFILKIEAEFENVTPGSIKGETVFRELDGWNSMMALILIAAIDSEMSVSITAEELATCRTIQDLYALAIQKKNST